MNAARPLISAIEMVSRALEILKEAGPGIDPRVPRARSGMVSGCFNDSDARKAQPQ